MEERADMILRQGDGPNPPGLLQQLIGSINDLIPTAGEAGGKWLGGKGDQEVAKALEIKAKAMSLIGQLQIERERLIIERDAAERAAANDSEKARMAHRERMFELRTLRLKDAVNCLIRLRDELGAEVDVRLIKQVIAQIASAVKEAADSA